MEGITGEPDNTGSIEPVALKPTIIMDLLLTLQSARRAYNKNQTYELALEVQIAEADYNREAVENRRAVEVIWVNPEEPIPAQAPERFWKLYTGKKDHENFQPKR